METKLYQESQTVMPIMLALILSVFLICLAAFLIHETMITDHMEFMSTGGIVFMISITIMAFVSVLIFIMRINVTVTYETLRVGIFKGRLVQTEDIDSVTAEEFSAMKDFLGWGFRIGPKGFGYIAAGTNKGLRIHLKTGKSFLISTKRPFEFENAMKMALKSIRE